MHIFTNNMCTLDIIHLNFCYATTMHEIGLSPKNEIHSLCTCYCSLLFGSMRYIFLSVLDPFPFAYNFRHIIYVWRTKTARAIEKATTKTSYQISHLEFWWAYQFNEFMHFWIHHLRRRISLVLPECYKRIAQNQKIRAKF